MLTAAPVLDQGPVLQEGGTLVVTECSSGKLGGWDSADVRGAFRGL